MEQQYQVTARKWRPQRFDEVVGQDHVTRTLKNAIKEGRLAHGYLFTGQRGCGKTTVARILAKAINCPNTAKNGYEPCNECEICKSITGGTSMDVAEIDGASNNGVEDVRAMRENVKYPPLQGQYRVVIIDEVHMLSPSAFNALLKTLEEPPQHLVFIFATTEVQKILPTILSRTQRYDFRRMQIDEIVTRLGLIAKNDKIKADSDSLLLVAKKADGSMRDAQSIFDQAVAFCGMNLEGKKLREALNLIDTEFFFECTDAIKEHATSKAFGLATEVVTRGYDVEEFINGLLDHLRNFLTVIATGKSELIEAVSHEQERYGADAKSFSEGDILRLTQIGFRSLERLKSSHSPRIVLELMLVEMTLLDRAIEIRSLLDELKGLKGETLPGTPATNSTPPSSPSPKVTPRHSPSIQAVAGTNAVPVIAMASADISEITEKWGEFIASVTATSIPFRMIEDDIEFGELRGTTIEIVVSKKHSDETFARNKEKFLTHLRQFFGNTSLGYEIKKVEKKITAQPNYKETKSATAEKTSSSIPPSITIDDGVERSELELALIKELGAMPL
ncbi:MAG TPA: DNA polymerase III subunit gamma/tau [Candidatus Kapabacteria bacterium]|nr:DNA polymerase III subunit gamma/tau [Candidatus Kapabacteria bacterium]